MKNDIQIDIFKPETLTSQRIFDFVVARLAEQERASTKDGKCVYRGDNGLKCAIGHLIPDKVYKRLLKDGYNMDANSGGDSVSVLALLRDKEDFIHLRPFVQLLRALQMAHDDSKDATYLREALEKIAAGYNLDPSIISSIRNWQDW